MIYADGLVCFWLTGSISQTLRKLTFWSLQDTNGIYKGDSHSNKKYNINKLRFTCLWIGLTNEHYYRWSIYNKTNYKNISKM